MCVCAQSCLTLRGPTDCSLPGSSGPWNLPGKNTLAVISSSRESFRPRNQTHVSCVSCIVRWIPDHCVTWEDHAKCLLTVQSWKFLFSPRFPGAWALGPSLMVVPHICLRWTMVMRRSICMHSLPKTEPRFRSGPPGYLPFCHLPDFLYKNHPCHYASWVSWKPCGMLPSGGRV